MISGGIKFFYQNFGDMNNDNASASVSSGSAMRNYPRSRKEYLKWSSIGSNDSTQETYEMNFGYDRDLDRIILKRNNFKAFMIQYWNGSAWTHFSNVMTKEGSQTNITETANTKSTNYYEFDEVSTDKILITIDTTQIANEEKEIYGIIATKEIGTFEGYPGYAATFDKKRAIKEGFDGKENQSILGENFSCSLDFQRYPLESDHLIIQELWELDEAFLIYPCGGDEDQFKYPDKKGNRLRDIYLIGFDSSFAPNYEQNVYQLSLNYSVSFKEAT